MTRVAIALVLVGSVAVAKSVAVTPMASGAVQAKSGSAVAGTAQFVAMSGKVTLTLDVTGLPPGEHAVHLHEKGDCSDPDAKNAGGHWNPGMMAHGKWDAMPHHLGDIGNLVAGANGKGKLTLTTDKWTIGDGKMTDVVGHALVIHGGVDDFKTQPTGNAGNRIGCAVITAAK